MRCYVYGVLLSALLLIGLTGCTFGQGIVAGFQPGEPVTETPTPTLAAVQPDSSPVGLQVGNVAPDFALSNLEGQTVRLSDLRGQAVLVNFWATWCGFCLFELPEMQSAYDAHRDQGFMVWAIDVREEAQAVRTFADDLDLSFPILLDEQGEVTLRYRVRGLPTTLFIDRDGVILGVQIGPVDKEWIEQHLAQVGVE